MPGIPDAANLNIRQEILLVQAPTTLTTEAIKKSANHQKLRMQSCLLPFPSSRPDCCTVKFTLSGQSSELLKPKKPSVFFCSQIEKAKRALLDLYVKYSMIKTSGITELYHRKMSRCKLTWKLLLKRVLLVRRVPGRYFFITRISRLKYLVNTGSFYAKTHYAFYQLNYETCSFSCYSLIISYNVAEDIIDFNKDTIFLTNRLDEVPSLLYGSCNNL